MRLGFFTIEVLAWYSACQPPLTPSWGASSLRVSPSLIVTVLPETAGAVVVAFGAAFGAALVVALGVVAFFVVAGAFVVDGAVRVVDREVVVGAAAVAAPPLALVRPARG